MPIFRNRMDRGKRTRSILITVGVRKDRPKGIVAAKAGAGVLSARELKRPRRGQ